MNDIGTQLNTVIDNLANKLGVAADKVWPMLIRQAHVDGAKYIIGFIVFGIIAAILWAIGIHAWRDGNEEVCGWCIAGAFVITFFWLGVLVFGGWVTAVWNPEYYALTKVLEMLPTTAQ